MNNEDYIEQWVRIHADRLRLDDIPYVVARLMATITIPNPDMHYEDAKDRVLEGMAGLT